MPKRIQRKRAEGWRMPENAIYVGRPTVWGNPFSPGESCGVFPEGFGKKGSSEILIDSLELDQCIEMYRDLIQGFIDPIMYPHGHEWMRNFKDRMTNGHPLEMARSHLSRHDLACWCPLDRPCHADVLLELANA